MKWIAGIIGAVIFIIAIGGGYKTIQAIKKDEKKKKEADDEEYEKLMSGPPLE